MNFETWTELEQVIENSENQIELEGSVVAGLLMASAQGKEVLCLGETGENGTSKPVLAEVEGELLCGCIFTSKERADAAGAECAGIDLAEYLYSLAVDERIDALVINIGTQNVMIEREELSLMQEVLEGMFQEPECVALRGVTNHVKGCEWVPDKACVLADEHVEFSDTAKRTIQHANYYMDGENCFALISDSVVYMADYNPKQGQDLYLEKLQESVEEAMDEANRYHPDFSKYVMDDGMLAVELFNSVWCLRSPEEFEDPYDEFGEPSLDVALMMRQEILDACAEGEVLAFVVNDMESE